MGIGGEHRFPASKGADKHQQRGFWKVKVGQKTAHDLKIISGREKNTGRARVRPQTPPLSDRRTMFERTCGGRAGSDDAIPRLQRGVYRFGGSCGESVVFGMKIDILYIFGANWLEGA